jgi:peptidyl-dipeptidase A
MTPLRLVLPCAVFVGLWVLCVGPLSASSDVTRRAREFVRGHDKRVKPLEIAKNLAWWNANTSGKAEDYKKKVEAENRLDEALADRRAFAELKALEGRRKQIDEPTLARSIHVLYLQYLEKQVAPGLLKKMVARANAVEEAFNRFRAKVDGKELSDNEVRDVLKTSLNSRKLRAAWEASKAVGARLEKDLKELVKLRNRAAVKLGFKNYHALLLYLNEQDGDKLLKLFDDLDALTRKPFAEAKADLDARLAKRYGLKPGELMPWHYHDPF